jgi:hypothetical protein
MQISMRTVWRSILRAAAQNDTVRNEAANNYALIEFRNFEHPYFFRCRIFLRLFFSLCFLIFASFLFLPHGMVTLLSQAYKYWSELVSFFKHKAEYIHNMGILEDLRQKWAETDQLDRNKLYIGLGFLVLIALLLLALSDTVNTLGGILGGGASYVNNTVGNAGKLVGQLNATK